MSGPLQFKLIAIFFQPAQSTEQNIKLHGSIFAILCDLVRRHHEPRSGLIHKNNEELLSNCPAP